MTEEQIDDFAYMANSVPNSDIMEIIRTEHPNARNFELFDSPDKYSYVTWYNGRFIDSLYYDNPPNWFVYAIMKRELGYLRIGN
jgi:hypothetical protein